MKQDQLIVVIEKANRLFKALTDKYGDENDYLVFSSRFGQCEITTDVKKILKDFPEMIVDSVSKTEAIESIKGGKQIENQGGNSNGPNHNINSGLKELEFRDDTFVEIRFSNLKFETIYQMQKDPLVSQKHTPQTRASIRIVLGTLGELLSV